MDVAMVSSDYTNFFLYIQVNTWVQVLLSRHRISPHISYPACLAPATVSHSAFIFDYSVFVPSASDIPRSFITYMQFAVS